jgi:aminopeptidase N
MRTDIPTMTRLEDYRPSDFLIDTIDLDVRLDPTETRIRAVLAIRPNPAGRAGAPLVLDGDELVLTGLLLDGADMEPSQFTAAPDALTLLAPPPRPFTLTIDTVVNPTANTKLMGLYRSSGVYCTQCEADGFRRITYSLDRPDILSVYTTRIEADRDEAPVLLGNGNPSEAGRVGENRHYAVWHDPFPKPGYLFALVGGRLGMIGSTYVTSSGRPVAIAVYVEPGKEDRAAYALDALARSMRWDERVFGREYDLEVFNIVAVSDFNMGAMENKGLNIFNDKYVLASPETATDADYAGIETVIAHEYFHNWTGNRITCRDWFQLCLKEGLTVFRDQEFSSDERSRSVHRIAEVRALRARQFAEDAGPLAHPVRPTRYREINNFYTATVYEKGAELVRMLKTLLGEADFARGMTRYFERFDGTAATVEDFLSAFAAVSGRDLSHFALWYEQAGTPAVAAESHYVADTRRYRLTLRQATPATPGQPDKRPLVIPIRLGFIGPDGQPLDLASERIGKDGVFVLDRAEDELVFDSAVRPVPSLLRGFSAPVKLTLDLDTADLLALLRHDSDAFNRWQAAQIVAMRLFVAEIRGGITDEAGATVFAEALAGFLERDATRDPAFAALVLALPGETEIAQELASDVDPDAVHRARERLRGHLGRALGPLLARLRDDLGDPAEYTPDAPGAGRRSLRNAALDLIAAGDPASGERLAGLQAETASNMTDRLAALATISRIPGDTREAAFAAFGRRFNDEPLVLDKWFALQASISEAGTLTRIEGLTAHPGFSFGNPNRVRSLIGGFALGNPTQFNAPDGSGYRFLADTVIALNGSNPQIAARLLTALGSWRMLEPNRRAAAEAGLRRIVAAPNLSPDVADIATRSLDGA